MCSYSRILLVLLVKITFDEGRFAEIIEIPKSVGNTYFCENDPSIDQCISSTKEHREYKNLKNQIMDIQNQCGELCGSSQSRSVTKGQYYDRLEVDMNCNNLWNTSIFDVPSKFDRAVQKLPSYIKLHFSYSNKVPIHSYYFDNLVKEQRYEDNANWGNWK